MKRWRCALNRWKNLAYEAFTARVRQRDAIRSGDVNALKEALRDSNGESVNAILHDTRKTLLQEAIEYGSVEMIKLLLDAGASPNIVTYDGHTAFDYSDPIIAATLRLYGWKKRGVSTL